MAAPPLPRRLRALRRERRWSLKELATRSGVSAAMLSEIERGTKSPTVRLAHQVALALGCSISHLLEAPDPPTGPAEAVVRLGPATVLDDPRHGVRREGHGHPLLHGRLEIAVYTLGPGARTGAMDPARPGTLETVLVLDGTLELTLDGRPTRLPAGASAVHGVHATEYRNPSTERACRFVVLVDSTRV